MLVRRVVKFELLKELVVFVRRRLVNRLGDSRLLAVFVEQLDPDVRLKERDQLIAELLFGRVHLTVRVNEIVHRPHQHFLVGAIEAFEEFKALELELGIDERVLVLVLRDRFGKEILNVAIDVLEHLAKVLREPLHQVRVDLGIGVRHADVYAVFDQLPDVVADKVTLGLVEVAIDVPERGQVKNDGVHLLLGDLRVLREAQHGGMIGQWRIFRLMRVGLFSLLLAATSIPNLGQAQDDVRAAARAFEQGQQAQLAGEYARAAQMFELAHRSAPAAAALRAAIRNHRAAGAASRAATLSLIAIVNYAADTDTRTLAQDVLRENEANLARVEMRCSAACEVLVDDRVASWDAATTHSFFTAPGERQVRASFESGNVDQTLTLTAGQAEQISVEAPAAPDPEPDPDPVDTEPEVTDPEDPRYRRDPVELQRPSRRGWSPIGTWIGLGVTAALGATLVWSLVDTFDASDQYKANPTLSGFNNGQDKVRRTWILGVTTGVAGITTILIAVLATDWGGDDDESVRPTLDLGPQRAGLGLRGAF